MSTEFRGSLDNRQTAQAISGRHTLLTNGSTHCHASSGKTLLQTDVVLNPGPFNPDLKIVQLFPHFDSAEGFVELDKTVALTMAAMDDNTGEVELISAGDRSMDELEGGMTALPPYTLRKIIEEFDDGGSDGDETDAVMVQPILHGKVVKQLSVSHDGFILLKHYKISFDVIGSGKLSEVRIAFDTRDGQQYAIKIFSKTKLQKFNMLLRTSRNPIEEAYREAAILHRLRHPNVIKLIEVIDEPEDDNIYLILELLEHVLIEIPTATPCTESVARRYFRDIIDGVAHIHSFGIVHCDLKPDNLLVSREGVVKVADFNICVELEKDEFGQEKPVESWHGTPAFCPPECVEPDQKKTAGRPLDLWSLGVTLYSMVVGDLPFKAELLPDLFESILNDPVGYPAGLVLSESLRSLLAGLLEKNPLKRMTVEQVQQHEWLTGCSGGRPRDGSARMLVKFSQRCTWDPPVLEDDAEPPVPVSLEMHRRGSVHDLEDDVQKLLHGYTFL